MIMALNSPALTAGGTLIAANNLTLYAFTLTSGGLSPSPWPMLSHDPQHTGRQSSGTGTTERVSVTSDGTQGNNVSYEASISADGRFVAFASYASNLVPNDTNGTATWQAWDVFVRDRQTGHTECVSVASDGTQDSNSSGASISADGWFVAFESPASNLVPDDTNGEWDVFVRDRQTGHTERVSVASDGTQGNSAS